MYRRIYTRPPKDDLYFTALNERENVITQHAALARTAYQRIYEIVLFKKKKRGPQARDHHQGDR